MFRFHGLVELVRHRFQVAVDRAMGSHHRHHHPEEWIADVPVFDDAQRGAPAHRSQGVGPGSSEGGILVGDTSVLKQYQARDIKEVPRLSAADATQKYGTGHSQGAILVTRRDR